MSASSAVRVVIQSDLLGTVEIVADRKRPWMSHGVNVARQLEKALADSLHAGLSSAAEHSRELLIRFEVREAAAPAGDMPRPPVKGDFVEVLAFGSQDRFERALVVESDGERNNLSGRFLARTANNCESWHADTGIRWRWPDEKCERCDGCGKIADSKRGEPWTAWEALPPGSDVAWRMGVVKPITCPTCKGTGKAVRR